MKLSNCSNNVLNKKKGMRCCVRVDWKGRERQSNMNRTGRDGQSERAGRRNALCVLLRVTTQRPTTTATHAHHALPICLFFLHSFLQCDFCVFIVHLPVCVCLCVCMCRPPDISPAVFSPRTSSVLPAAFSTTPTAVSVVSAPTQMQKPSIKRSFNTLADMDDTSS